MTNCQPDAKICYYCGREVATGRWIQHPIGKLTVEAYICPVCAKSIKVQGESHD